MDLYVREFNKLVSDNNFIVQTTNERHDTDTGNIIILRPDLYDTCPAKLELSNALMKRLQKPGASYTTAQICATAICCICSQSYTVSHTKMRSVTDKAMMDIWTHLEILSVSSSYNLQQWIKACLKSRSKTGYVMYHRDTHSLDNDSNFVQILRRPTRRRNATKPEFIHNAFLERTFGSCSSVSAAMKTDMKVLSALCFLDNKDSPNFPRHHHLEELD